MTSNGEGLSLANEFVRVESLAAREPAGHLASAIDDNTRHVVLISGGLASAVTALRVRNVFAGSRLLFVFFDTLGEDDDLYRFLGDLEQHLEIPIEQVSDGRDIWTVFRDERFIGNSRADVCARILKREMLMRYLADNALDSNTILYFGLDWTETHRIRKLSAAWRLRGYVTDFPLLWPVPLSPNELRYQIEELGIRVPRLYDLGFPHNNCGGGCVKAGMSQWAHLWRTFPDRYKWHEEQEASLRAYLEKDVSILRDRSGGHSRPLTLRDLRVRLELGQYGDRFGATVVADDAPCSCFAHTGGVDAAGTR